MILFDLRAAVSHAHVNRPLSRTDDCLGRCRWPRLLVVLASCAAPTAKSDADGRAGRVQNCLGAAESRVDPHIFTKDAVYHERVLQEPIRGHEGIAAYWQEKVVKGQGRISFTLLNTKIDGSTGIAEWEVSFDDVVQRKRKHMKEIAILEFVDGKIASLREYWASEVTGAL